MHGINKIAVGARIREIRLARGMTLEEFGNLFSASKSIASRWEKGKSIPNNNRIKAITDMANISVQELLYGIKEKVMYGIDWWNGEISLDSEQKPLPVVFTSKDAADKWLIDEGYYKNSNHAFAGSFDYVRGIPAYYLNEWPDEEYARIFKMEVVE